MRRVRVLAAAVLLLPFASAAAGGEGALPVDTAALPPGARAIDRFHAGNLFTLDRLFEAITGGKGDLFADLRSMRTLLDGTEIDPEKIYGFAYAGPYPLEAKEVSFAYKRFGSRTRIAGGRCALGVARLLAPWGNSEGWTDGGRLCIRFDLHLESEKIDRDLGVYDLFVSFRKTGERFEKLPSLVEGPFVCLARSDDPSNVVIRFRTSEAVEGTVLLGDGRRFSPGGPRRVHEVVLTGLAPSAAYDYRVEIAGRIAASHSFRSAPRAGEGEVTIAYMGDSRAGRGGGMRSVMGVNHLTIERFAAIATRMEADLFLVGGDLVAGYTSSPEDFATQLAAWKEAITGFWNARPVYPAMGNHDALLRVFSLPGGGRVLLDRWPYATESAEALFADAFVNPTGGPVPSDPRRPPYRENVYAFRYGPVLCIAFNNNYWVSEGLPEAGGSPEGYILEDQLAWIESRLLEAENDRTVRYVVLYGQEPVFPSGGHVGDAMWYDGDNRVRAGTFRGGRVAREEAGIVEVRNRFVRAVARSSKVAVVLGSDEHGYSRVRIGRDVPIGDPSRDDRDGNGKIDWPREPCSPLADLAHDTWYVVSAGAGAPYYGEEPSPWSAYAKKRSGEGEGYLHSSEENLLLFHAGPDRIDMTVYNPHGEVFDRIPDLMAGK